MSRNNISLDVILTAIEQTDDHGLSQIIQAVVRRYGRVHPEWEVIFLSMAKSDAVQRQKQIEALFAFLHTHEK